MPPKKNKQSKSGYWQFAMECRDKQPGKHANMEELQNYAGSRWAGMSKEQRRPYEERAGLASNNASIVKYSSQGLDLAVIQRREDDAVRTKKVMENDINKIFGQAALAQTLDDQIFLIIHINHLTYHPSSDRFFVCEVAVAPFSLRSGIGEVFHAIVKPGELPLGFYGDAKIHSKETHQLIEFVQQDDENNNKEVYQNLITFMKKYATPELPILYSPDKTFEMTAKVMDTWAGDCNDQSKIKVYNLQYMLYALKNACAGKQIWPSVTFSFSELEKDVYCFCPNIACDFHEAADVILYCSKSIVTRYAYVICDNCCPELQISLIPGHHVPFKAKVNDYQSRTVSRCSSVSGSAWGNGRHSFNPKSKQDVLNPGEFDENFPSLGGSETASIASFRTLTGASTSLNNRSTIAAQFTGLSVNQKRDHKNMKFPQHGYKKTDQ